MRYLILILSLLAFPNVGEAQERVKMVLGGVAGVAGGHVNTVNGQLTEEHPGSFIELSQRAADQCGADIDFDFMAWARVLKQIEIGSIAGGFYSSYKSERAVYGVYPLLDGRPDEKQASLLYNYFAYGRRDGITTASDLKGVKVAVERNASIIPDLKKRGALITEHANYTAMLKFVALGRASLAIGIDRHFDPILEQDDRLLAEMTKIWPPLFEKVGYVMFSKIFYATHGPLVDCFWETSSQLRDTAWFIDLREQYRQQ